jgi:MoaA/NifB/PqqE/SkfB family radical SAM enzyme
MNSITSVCWDITSKCNDACKFCFRDANSVDLPLADNLIILNKLIDYGIKKITFTGGEASLYHNLWHLIQCAHNHEIYTNLVTNMEKYLNCITLSLDGPDPIVDLLYNTEDSYYTMMHGIR